jgi:hypothetical protein
MLMLLIDQCTEGITEAQMALCMLSASLWLRTALV